MEIIEILVYVAIIVGVVALVRAILKHTVLGDIINVVWYLIKTYWWVALVAFILLGVIGNVIGI